MRKAELLFKILVLAFVLPFFSDVIHAQDSVNVTFRYTPNENALRAFLPGEFNNWGNNSAGRISTTDGSLMTEDAGNGFWVKTIRLQVGGGTATFNGKPGYAYKFHEQYNGSGDDWAWFSDPLNSKTVGQNSDSFIEVTHPLIFQFEPLNNALTEGVAEVWATVAAKDSDSISTSNSKIFVNGVLAGSFDNYYDKSRQLLHIPDIEELGQNLAIGQNTIRIEAFTTSGASSVNSTSFTFAPDLTIVKEVRPVGLEDGITYSDSDPGTVTLSLFAPGKESVFVIGDFNDWQVDLQYLMKQDSLKSDSVWYWIEITGLTPGEQYGFQYLIDGDLRIADPYSELVLHPTEDSFIPESVYPNLKEYPTGKTTNYVGVLLPGKPEFQWTASEYQRPAKEDLVIYELLIRDFLADHSYSSLIDSLDYLQRLGINAIELMPVNEFDGNESWGYNPSFHLALDKYYGPADEFKQFIDEAHKRGIAVILDVVMNHATGRNPLYRLYEFGSNPYFNTSPTHSFNVFNDFNHQYSGTQYYNKRMIEFWIEEYRIDGFRWDLTKGFTQNCSANDEGCTSSYQQDRVDLLKKYADYQWAADPDFHVIFEHLGGDTEEQQWANYRADEGKGVMLWGNMNGTYNEATMGYNEGGKSDFSRVLSSSRGFTEERLIGYMESHDEQWLMFKNISFGNSSGDYDVTELNTALGRQKLAGAFFFTLPGPKMMWQFGELGYGYGNNGEQCLKPGNGSDGDCPSFAPDRVDNKPIRWDYWNNPDTEERVKLYKTWAALISLRKSSPVFTNPDNLTKSFSNRYKRLVLEHSDTDVVIVGNFGVTAAGASGNFTQTGTWYDFFEGTEYEVTTTDQTVTLDPGEVKIFTTKQFDAPEPGLITSNESDSDSGTPTSFRLYNNYPNPFNPTTNLSFDIPNVGMVTLEVFDVLGRKVSTLINERKAPGSYTISFNANGLSSGIYFARLSTDNNIQIKKMTLLK